MGQTSADTKREIDALRFELNAIIDELQLRGRAAVDVRVQIARRPVLAAGVLIAIVASVCGLAYALASRARARRRAQARLERRAAEWVSSAWQRWRPSWVRSDRAPTDHAQPERAESSLVLAALSTLVPALAAPLARRASSLVWQRLMRDRPPRSRAGPQ